MNFTDKLNNYRQMLTPSALRSIANKTLSRLCNAYCDKEIPRIRKRPINPWVLYIDAVLRVLPAMTLIALLLLIMYRLIKPLFRVNSPVNEEGDVLAVAIEGAYVKIKPHGETHEAGCIALDYPSCQCLTSHWIKQAAVYDERNYRLLPIRWQTYGTLINYGLGAIYIWSPKIVGVHALGTSEMTYLISDACFGTSVILLLLAYISKKMWIAVFAFTLASSGYLLDNATHMDEIHLHAAAILSMCVGIILAATGYCIGRKTYTNENKLRIKEISNKYGFKVKDDGDTYSWLHIGTIPTVLIITGLILWLLPALHATNCFGDITKTDHYERLKDIDYIEYMDLNAILADMNNTRRALRRLLPISYARVDGKLISLGIRNGEILWYLDLIAQCHDNNKTFDTSTSYYLLDDFRIHGFNLRYGKYKRHATLNISNVHIVRCGNLILPVKGYAIMMRHVTDEARPKRAKRFWAVFSATAGYSYVAHTCDTCINQADMETYKKRNERSLIEIQHMLKNQNKVSFSTFSALMALKKVYDRNFLAISRKINTRSNNRANDNMAELHFELLNIYSQRALYYERHNEKYHRLISNLYLDWLSDKNAVLSYAQLAPILRTNIKRHFNIDAVSNLAFRVIFAGTRVYLVVKATDDGINLSYNDMLMTTSCIQFRNDVFYEYTGLKFLIRGSYVEVVDPKDDMTECFNGVCALSSGNIVPGTIKLVDTHYRVQLKYDVWPVPTRKRRNLIQLVGGHVYTFTSEPCSLTTWSIVETRIAIGTGLHVYNVCNRCSYKLVCPSGEYQLHSFATGTLNPDSYIKQVSDLASMKILTSTRNKTTDTMMFERLNLSSYVSDMKSIAAKNEVSMRSLNISLQSMIAMNFTSEDRDRLNFLGNLLSTGGKSVGEALNFIANGLTGLVKAILSSPLLMLIPFIMSGLALSGTGFCLYTMLTTTQRPYTVTHKGVSAV